MSFFTGKIFNLVGVFPRPLDEVKAQLARAGGIATRGVHETFDYIVVGELTGVNPALFDLIRRAHNAKKKLSWGEFDVRLSSEVLKDAAIYTSAQELSATPERKTAIAKARAKAEERRLREVAEAKRAAVEKLQRERAEVSALIANAQKDLDDCFDILPKVAPDDSVYVDTDSFPKDPCPRCGTYDGVREVIGKDAVVGGKDITINQCIVCGYDYVP